MKNIFAITFIVVCFLSNQVKAQLFVDTSYTVQQMMEDFFDSTGATISNVTYTGVPAAVGFFDAGNTNLAINAGIMLTSGQVFNAVGPNVNSGITSDNGSVGDSELTQLCGSQTYDASVIEFDIVALQILYSFSMFLDRMNTRSLLIHPSMMCLLFSLQGLATLIPILEQFQAHRYR